MNRVPPFAVRPSTLALGTSLDAAADRRRFPHECGADLVLSCLVTRPNAANTSISLQIEGAIPVPPAVDIPAYTDAAWAILQDELAPVAGVRTLTNLTLTKSLAGITVGQSGRFLIVVPKVIADFIRVAALVNDTTSTPTLEITGQTYKGGL